MKIRPLFPSAEAVAPRPRAFTSLSAPPLRPGDPFIGFQSFSPAIAELDGRRTDFHGFDGEGGDDS